MANRFSSRWMLDELLQKRMSYDVYPARKKGSGTNCSTGGAVWIRTSSAALAIASYVTQCSHLCAAARTVSAERQRKAVPSHRTPHHFWSAATCRRFLSPLPAVRTQTGWLGALGRVGWGLTDVRPQPPSRMNQSASVGSYPEGASPYGCLDVVGNDWEWVSEFSCLQMPVLSCKMNVPVSAAARRRDLGRVRYDSRIEYDPGSTILWTSLWAAGVARIRFDPGLGPSRH